MRLPQYLLSSLLIVLVLSGIPCAGCTQQETRELQLLDVGGEDPPTIEWIYSSENATMATCMEWDGVYTGQTQLTWAYSSWISDSDGVDTVFFQYRHSYTGEWMNRTPALTEGNATTGKYSYTFTQQITWDWDTSKPVVEGGLYVEFRIFANDTLGNWRTTLQTAKSGYWLSVQPPPVISDPDTFPVIIVVSIVLIAVCVVVLYLKRR